MQTARPASDLSAPWNKGGGWVYKNSRSGSQNNAGRFTLIETTPERHLGFKRTNYFIRILIDQKLYQTIFLTINRLINR